MDWSWVGPPLDLFASLGPQLDELWASLDLGRTGEAVSWAAPGVPAPVWLDVAREYTEHWVHQQQVRDAVSRPGADGERLTAPVADTFLRAAPHALRHISRDPGICVEIQVTGPGNGAWTIERRASTWQWTAARPNSQPPHVSGCHPTACGGRQPGASPWRPRTSRPSSPAIRRWDQPC